MAEIHYVDLVELLRLFKGGIKHCTVYGRFIEKVDYPPVLKPGVALADNGVFGVMDVFAVSLPDCQSFLRSKGVYNKDGVYMVNGSILFYADGKMLQGEDWYQITGTLRRPSGNPISNCVALFNFYKTAQSWGLSPCTVEDLDICGWDRHSPSYNWMRASDDAAKILHPPEVGRMQRFEHYDASVTPVLRKQSGVDSDDIVPESEAPAIRSTVQNFNKENRSVVKECGALYQVLEDKQAKALEAKRAFIGTMLADYSTSLCSDGYLKYMVNGLLSYFTKRRSTYALTGRAIIKRYLETSNMAHERYIGTRTAGDYIVDNFQNFAQFILDNRVTINADGVALDLCRAMLGDREHFYAGVVGVVVGIPSETVEDMAQFCKGRGLSITKILNENPYMLQFFTSLDFDEIERIAMCFGRHEDASLSKYRNTAMLNAYISDPNNGSTMYRYSHLVNSDIGVRLTKARFQKVRQGMTYLTEAMATNIDSFIRNTKSPTLTYSVNGFRQTRGGNFVRALSRTEVETAVGDYIQTGLGVVEDDYITSSDLLKKELFVFNTMRALASKTYDYKREDIDKCIAEYEALVGFKLEKSQVEAVHLLTNGAFVVAGSAGSGKTTVSRCVVYTLRKLSPELEIKFAAPTGKAAKRMQEVVQEECRTLHSTFRISYSPETVFSEENTVCKDSDTAFFFDESAMITIDLMYKVLRNVSVDSSRIFLFGDFNQLSPIGKGLPFKNLLRFMPCVFLDVVKRAAEGSNITANSCIVNENSDAGKWKWLRNGKDCFILSCGSSHIQGVVHDLCAHYLGKKKDNGVLARALMLDCLPEVPGITPDDIQVVTPLAKEAYQWGTACLNERLQPLFNSARSFDQTFISQATKLSKPYRFMIGDRVIHTDKNMYSMQWYGTYKAGLFQKIYGQGICNGEVGKVVGFLPADKAKFKKESEPMPEGFEYTENLRSDETYNSRNAYFVVVEYYDFISARNFYILYRAELNQSIQSNEGVVLKGDDVNKLNLFYAGTTHKLQGSQAKVIICALDDVPFGGFITRQMVYTMMTRAEKLCFFVGSVGNTKDSMLTKARLDIASADTLTVGELLV